MLAMVDHRLKGQKDAMAESRRVASWFLGVAIAVASSMAEAALIKYQFTGTVFQSQTTAVLQDDPIVGSFLYDNAAPQVLDAGTDVYYGWPYAFSYTISGKYSGEATGLEARVSNTFSGVGIVRLGEFTTQIPRKAQISGDLIYDKFPYLTTLPLIDFVDNDESFISSTALPAQLILSEFNTAQGYITYRGPNDPGSYIWYKVDSLSEVPIPEPSTIVCFALGLAGMGYQRRKRAA